VGVKVFSRAFGVPENNATLNVALNNKYSILFMRQYFTKAEIPFHIFNHGTEERKIFNDYAEYCRFIFLMWVYRIGSPKRNMTQKETIQAAEAILTSEEPPESFYNRESSPLTTFITWNLLPNHFHFILISLIDGGISKYMNRIANAYTKYFNARHERRGRLFQNSYQSIGVKDIKYAMVLLRYINLNHAKLVEPNWKEHRLQDRVKIRQFTDSYKWSAHLDYMGKRHSLLIDYQTVSELFEVEFDKNGFEGYEDFIDKWFKDDFEDITKYILE